MDFIKTLLPTLDMTRIVFRASTHNNSTHQSCLHLSKLQFLQLHFKTLMDLEYRSHSIGKVPYFIISSFDHGRISLVGRAFDCGAGGRGFDCQGRTITQGLKMTERWRYFLCTASGETFAWLGWPRKMAVPSPLGDVKIVSPISTFVLNTLALK